MGEEADYLRENDEYYFIEDLKQERREEKRKSNEDRTPEP